MWRSPFPGQIVLAEALFFTTFENTVALMWGLEMPSIANLYLISSNFTKQLRGKISDFEEEGCGRMVPCP